MVRRDETRTVGRLAGDVLAGAVGAVQDLHRAIAGRAFAAAGPATAPVRVVHDGVAGVVYGVVRGAHAAVPRAGATLAAAAAGGDGPALSATPSAALALSILNGLWGDTLVRRYPELALTMSLRAGGHDVSATPPELAAAYPEATSRLALFVHGLCEHDESWYRPARPSLAEDGRTYGSRLQEDLGYTPLYLRYNTGLRVSANGQGLARLLEDLVAAWPVSVADLILVGHSMGGLVSRSACHYGEQAGYAWTDRLRHVICLGTPHLGAPLEQGVNAASWLLGRLPETRPAARFLNLRSLGVKDLRYGSCVEEDWRDGDPDEFLRDRCTEVPFLPSAAYSFVGVTITKDPDSPLGALAGDLLVQFPSASGRGRTRRIPFAVDNGAHFGGLHHFDLLNHPAIYEQLRTWATLNAAATA